MSDREQVRVRGRCVDKPETQLGESVASRWLFRRRRTLFRDASERHSWDSSEHPSERSDAGSLILHKVFEIVKESVRSEAEEGLNLKRGWGTGPAFEAPSLQQWSDPERVFSARPVCREIYALTLRASRCGERYARFGRECRPPRSDRRSVRAISPPAVAMSGSSIGSGNDLRRSPKTRDAPFR